MRQRVCNSIAHVRGEVLLELGEDVRLVVLGHLLTSRTIVDKCFARR